MISLYKIEKHFENEKELFGKFSYTFENKGFYLISGKSGCGKTTLLNIICGIEKVDAGKAVLEDIENIAYITQDTYYIDYLNVFDNLMLAAKKNIKEDVIIKICKRLDLYNCLGKYLSVLSGGEKQRLAIARALVQEKKILIMDEPTASLDKKNTEILLSILSELKKEFLIITASHDKSYFNYADYVIDFENLTSTYKDLEETVTRVHKKNGKKLKTLIKYMRKEKKYKNREKKSSVYMVVLLVVVFLVTNYFYDINSKFEDALFERYKINRALVYCKKDSVDKLYEYDGVKEVVYVQGTNIPYTIRVEGEEKDTSGMFANGDTLPFERKYFPYCEEIKYGNYFKKDNQVILGYEMALMYDENVSNLIGKKIVLNPLDKEREYEICGIFDRVSYDLDMYFYAAGQKMPDYAVFFSDKDLNNLKNNENAIMECAGLDGKTYKDSIAVYVYFDDIEKFKSFYNKYDREEFFTVAKLKASWVNEIIGYYKIRKYVDPINICVISVAILFFFQTKLMEINYNSKILAVYNYNGYKTSKIRLSYMIVQIEKIIKYIVVAVLISTILSYLFNKVQYITNFCLFTPFAIDIEGIFKLSLVFMITTMMLSVIAGSMLNIKGWMTLLKKNRDLL